MTFLLLRRNPGNAADISTAETSMLMRIIDGSDVSRVPALA